MASETVAKNSLDLWSQVIVGKEGEAQQQKQISGEEVYRRRRPSRKTPQDEALKQTEKQISSSSIHNENRVRLAAAAGNKRISWNRSLSTRGRTSVAIRVCVDHQFQQKQGKRRGKPALPKGKFIRHQSFDKERTYFEEVDAFELLEESPSPKRSGTWVVGNQFDTDTIPPLASRLEKWLKSKKLNSSIASSTTLSKILETPFTSMENNLGNCFNSSMSYPEKPCRKITACLLSDKKRFTSGFMDNDAIEIDSGSEKPRSRLENQGTIGRDDIEFGMERLSLASTSISDTPEKSSQKIFSSGFLDHNVIQIDSSSAKRRTRLVDLVGEDTEDCEVIDLGVKKLSLEPISTSTSSDQDRSDPFLTLLGVCGQSVPSTLNDAFSQYCDPKTIVKVGEGTYGEAFKAGNTVCKIVPIDGDRRVNGEVQKRSEELLEEVVLSRTLNCLRRFEGSPYNMTTTFIETKDLRVCQGLYDPALVRAWEDWDEKNGSENDHPKQFPNKQCYVVFVLQHGGKDLESFVLLNFDEARSLLVQVTSALAVAEAAYEFEHRDLHWGNVLLSRSDSTMLHFTLEGKHMTLKTFGLLVSVIDFTLSRINTGEDILFLDLSSDPDLFKGPKGDPQSETYRKMKKETEDCWEGSSPRTNVLWLVYLVDILLVKKSFERTSKNERDLRSLKKRLDKYLSAKEAIVDPFFTDLLD